VAVALTNNAAPNASRQSIGFDPIASTEQGSRDTLVEEVGEHYEVYLASFDLDTLWEYQARESWGNTFRKRQRYGLLVEQCIEDQFVQVNIHDESYHSNKR
jgi:5-aminopentanamidase